MHTPMFDDGTVVLRGSDASEMSAPETEVLIKARELDLCGNLLTALPPALFVEGDSWKEVAACRNKLEKPECRNTPKTWRIKEACFGDDGAP